MPCSEHKLEVPVLELFKTVHSSLILNEIDPEELTLDMAFYSSNQLLC
jgi:hypothetical protein